MVYTVLHSLALSQLQVEFLFYFLSLLWLCIKLFDFRLVLLDACKIILL